MLPDEMMFSGAFCTPALMPAALLPVVMMSAVELMVTGPPLLTANTPSASVVRIANGLGLMFRSTAPLLVNSMPVVPDAGAMFVVRLLTLSTEYGPPALLSSTLPSR
jgi:hypothetical protein